MTPPAPARARLRALLAALSYEHRPVKLASGARSSFYFDCKQTALHPEGAWALGCHLLDLVEALEAQAGRTAAGVGGMTLGADPLATAVSIAAHLRGRHLPAFIVRKEPKSHGTGRWVEGRRSLPDGSAVVLLEDVVTSGGTTLQALDRVREDGLEAFAVAVVVDREAGGMERLTTSGLAAQALFRASDFSPDAS